MARQRNTRLQQSVEQNPPVREYSYEDVPTIWRFAQCDYFQRVLMGPFGSGKSSGCVIEILRRAYNQAPMKDGVRRTRWVVVRNTNRELDDTTLPTWMYWMGRYGTYEKTPRNFILDKLKAPDGSPVYIEVMFRPLDAPEDVDNLLSLEVTGAWFNEVREIPKLIWDTMQGRAGRYPPASDGGATWSGIFGDTNPPDTDHWIYHLFEEDRPRVCPKCKNPDGGAVSMVRKNPKDYTLPLFCPVCNLPEEEGIPTTAIFKQPSGRSPNAENIRNLPKGYYSQLMVGKDPQWINVYVDGNYGYVREGKPVYPNWSEHFHLAPQDREPHRGYPLIIGYDFARHPAAVICQALPQGVFFVYDEFLGEDMDARQFAREVIRPVLFSKYLGMKTINFGDPSGVRRSDTDSRTSFMEFRDNGIIIEPAPSNAWEARYQAVNQLLIKRGPDGRGLFQLNPRCKILRRGFNGEYRMDRVHVVGKEMYKDRPVKNLASHVHDALQYAALGYEKRGVESRTYSRDPSFYSSSLKMDAFI